MADEAANGFSPAPSIGDILANQFGLEVAGEGAPSGGNRILVSEHCCGLFHCIPYDGLDVVG